MPETDNFNDIPEDSDLTHRESEIKDTLASIEKHITCNGLIALIYNPIRKGGEIIEDDSKNISAFIDGLDINQATVLLHGPGGDFNEAYLITQLFRKRFKTYRTLIPQICSSALCLLVLKSDKLILLKDGSITQIDPYFEYEGQPIRAIKNLKHEDPVIKEKSNKVFHYAEEKIFELISEKPSLYRHDVADFEHIDKENIIDALLNKDDHSDDMKTIEFQYIPFNVDFKEDKELSQLCGLLIKQVQNYLIVTDRRYCIASTNPTSIEDKITGNKQVGSLLFCP